MLFDIVNPIPCQSQKFEIRTIKIIRQIKCISFKSVQFIEKSKDEEPLAVSSVSQKVLLVSLIPFFFRQDFKAALRFLKIFSSTLCTNGKECLKVSPGFSGSAGLKAG